MYDRSQKYAQLHAGGSLYLANVGSSSAVIRRTTATILTVLVINGRNPKL